MVVIMKSPAKITQDNTYHSGKIVSPFHFWPVILRPFMIAWISILVNGTMFARCLWGEKKFRFREKFVSHDICTSLQMKEKNKK
jgi:hypothetical protein